MVARWRDGALEPLLARRDELRATIGDDQWVVARTEVEGQASLAIREAEAALQEAGQRYQAKLAELHEWRAREDSKASAAIARQQLKVDLLEKDNEAEKALDARLAKKRAEADSDLKERKLKQQKDCDLVPKLEAEKEASIKELREGAYHDKCDRTATQILAQTGQILAEHLGEEGGEMIPAPQGVIDAAIKAYDDKIARASDTCDAHVESIRAAAEKWIETIQGIDAQRLIFIERHKQALAAAKEALYNLRAQAVELEQRFHRAMYDLQQANMRTMIALRGEISAAYAKKQASLDAFDRANARRMSRADRALASVEREIARVEARARELDFKISSSNLTRHQEDIVVTSRVNP